MRLSPSVSAARRSSLYCSTVSSRACLVRMPTGWRLSSTTSSAPAPSTRIVRRSWGTGSVSRTAHTGTVRSRSVARMVSTGRSSAALAKASSGAVFRSAPATVSTLSAAAVLTAAVIMMGMRMSGFFVSSSRRAREVSGARHDAAMTAAMPTSAYASGSPASTPGKAPGAARPNASPSSAPSSRDGAKSPPTSPPPMDMDVARSLAATRPSRPCAVYDDTASPCSTSAKKAKPLPYCTCGNAYATAATAAPAATGRSPSGTPSKPRFMACVPNCSVDAVAAAASPSPRYSTTSGAVSEYAGMVKSTSPPALHSTMHVSPPGNAVRSCPARKAETAVERSMALSAARSKEPLSTNSIAKAVPATGASNAAATPAAAPDAIASHLSLSTLVSALLTP
mmetsp:Transcript_23917/g.81597  ORF Transcript_23917/g.81597 Transcript_23917/m.81597 type:complete len:395 (+) Transcript_23917:314-1498(+)